MPVAHLSDRSRRWSMLVGCVMVVLAVSIDAQVAHAQTPTDTARVFDRFAHWVYTNDSLAKAQGRGRRTLVEMDTAASLVGARAPFLARYPNAASLHPEAHTRALFVVQTIQFDQDTARVTVQLTQHYRSSSTAPVADYSSGTDQYVFVRRGGDWAPFLRLTLRREDGVFSTP